MRSSDYIQVGLYVRGETLDPERVSSELGIAPTDSQYKGKRSATSTERLVVAKLGVWSLVVESDTGLLSDQLDILLARMPMGDISAPIYKIPGVEEAYIDIFVDRIGNERTEGCQFELSRQNLISLSKPWLACALYGFANKRR